MNLILAFLFSDMPLEKISQFTALVNQDQHSRVTSECFLFLQHGCLGDTGALWGQCRSIFRKFNLLISFFMTKWPPSVLQTFMTLQGHSFAVSSKICGQRLLLSTRAWTARTWGSGHHVAPNSKWLWCPLPSLSQPASLLLQEEAQQEGAPSPRKAWPWEGHWFQKAPRSIDPAQVINPHPVETVALLQSEREPCSE